MEKCNHLVVDLLQLFSQNGELLASGEVSIEIFLQVAHYEGQGVCEESGRALAISDAVANSLLQ